MEGANQGQNPILDQDNNISGFTDPRSTKEKIISGLILIVAVSAVFIGFYELSANINLPIDRIVQEAAQKVADRQPSIANCTGENCQTLQQQIAAILELKAKDTDQDGLSDYDELNIYGTSPYLPDTDSDGYSDKKEVDDGYDPNCPGDENCFYQPSQVSEVGYDYIPQNSDEMVNGIPESQYQIIREVLMDIGLTQEQVAQLSHDDLLSVYYELQIMNDQNTNSLPNVAIENNQSANYLSADEIRQSLLEQGVPADMLADVTDEELEAMFLQSLSNMTQ